MFQTRTNRRIRDILWLPDGQLGLVHEDMVRVCWLHPGSGKLKTVRTFTPYYKNALFIYRNGKLQTVSVACNTQLVLQTPHEEVWRREYSVTQDIEGNEELVRQTFPANELYHWSGTPHVHGDSCLIVETNKDNGHRVIRDTFTNKVVADYHISVPLHDSCWTWKVNLFTGEDGSLFSYDIEDLYIWKNAEWQRVPLGINSGRVWTHPFISKTGGLFVAREHYNVTPYYQYRNGGWEQQDNLPIQTTTKGRYGLSSDGYGRLYYTRYNSVQVYDPVRRTHVQAFGLDEMFYPCISVSPDSTRLAAWNNQHLVVLDIE